MSEANVRPAARNPSARRQALFFAAAALPATVVASAAFCPDLGQQLAGLVLRPAAAQETASGSNGGGPSNVFTAKVGAAASRVSPTQFGVNSLYWVETDGVRAGGKLAETYRSLGVDSARYPGGEVADNFNWKTNGLDNPNSFPGEPPKDPGPARASRMSYTEFLQLAENSGASPRFVVNLEGAWAQDSVQLDAYAKRAADWVRAVNSNGTRVKYWEIGNESYFPGTRYSLTPEQYAHAFVKFAREMKKVDPNIKVCAIGPSTAADPGFAGKLTPSGVNAYRQMRLSQGNQYIKDYVDKKGPDALLNELNGGAKVQEPGSWWATVASIAGKDIDVAITHQYPQSTWNQNPQTAEKVRGVRKLVEEKKGGPVELGVTEYNAKSSAAEKMTEHHHGVFVGRMMLNLLRSGASVMDFWPVHLSSPSPSLLDDQMRLTSAGEVFRKIAQNAQGQVKPVSVPGGGNIEAVATGNGNKTTYFFVNASGSDKRVKVPGKVSWGHTLVQSGTSSKWISSPAQGSVVVLPGGSFSMVVG